MNNTRIVQAAYPSRSDASARDRIQPRSIHRERDFGVGYGNSSGYGQDRRYADRSARPMFRCG